MRRWKRKGLEQEGVNYAEDRRVSANAEGEREDRDQSEPWLFCQHPESESDIAHKIIRFATLRLDRLG